MANKWIKQYYDSGALLDECEVDEEKVANGVYRSYYESGALRESATFSSGLMEGPEEEYYENGQLQVRRVYANGRVVDSVVTAMNMDGSLSETEYWSMGRCRSSDAAGNLSREFELFNASRTGNYKSYYKNGRLYDELQFDEGLKHGVCKTYYENGVLKSEESYKFGDKNGLYREYFTSGKLACETNFWHDVPHGKYAYFYPNGQLQEEGIFDKGILIDVKKMYYENGNIKYEVPLKDGLSDGIAKAYDENGNLEKLVSCHKGKIEGVTKTFHNGKLVRESFYENGKKQGISKFYRESGVLFRTETYVDGVCRDSKEYSCYCSGRLLSETNMSGWMPEGQEVYYHENGTVKMRLVYRNGMVVDGKTDVFDENGEKCGYCVFKNSIGRIYDNDGNLEQEWQSYRHYRNGPVHFFDEDIFFYMACDTVCESKEDFIEMTIKDIAGFCYARFSEKRPDYTEETYKTFFADEYRAATSSPLSQIEYDDYAEYENCDLDSLPDNRFVEYVVHEFFLRFRLPNDGETEKKVLRKLLDKLGL